ncbi:glutamine amidotransferase [Sorangium cellulosum]|uniref:Glutamine amidotransferase n=1 Tax=Sorangium cellulosum TaxID=56 RepID=A0A2L0EL04_SORCE|nr:DJ-1/PfpI family protein [Sorangium cellulosum]AUX39968.1 glutamine amidotransferase [Sorangium cellulosum]
MTESYDIKMPGPQPLLQVGMVLYPGLTMLDLIGPQNVLAPHAATHLLWKTRDLVTSDSGVSIQPTATFRDCPDELDILFVPGGIGTADAMADQEILQFLRDRGARSKYVTSVCTGSLVLAAAGLMQGYKATTHWATRHILEAFGVECVRARVVVDRNRISGGGVTAGIDFGLTLLGLLRGDDAARLTQLMLEYDPAPPFDAGTPEAAGPELTQRILSFLEPLDRTMRKVAAERSISAS